MGGKFDTEHAALIGRIGGLVTQSRHDAREFTAPARRAFLRRFEEAVDPSGVLPAEERERRAQLARRAHMSRLALASAEARKQRQGASPAKGEAAAR